DHRNAGAVARRADFETGTEHTHGTGWQHDLERSRWIVLDGEEGEAAELDGPLAPDNQPTRRPEPHECAVGEVRRLTTRCVGREDQRGGRGWYRPAHEHDQRDRRREQPAG